MGPITIDVTFAVTVLGLITAIGTALWKIHALVARFEKLEKQAYHRKEDDEAIMMALIACLKGLIQQGCNGPVTKALAELEKHIIESR